MDPSLPPAPGAKAAKRCGIASILLGLTCVGIPIGIALGIIALVKQGKAKAAAKAEPERYETPSQTGLVTGIIGLIMPVFMLPFLGIVSAIAIPAMLSQRARARDKASISNMISRQSDLIGEYYKLADRKVSDSEIPARLDLFLKTSAPQYRNPWAPAGNSASFDYHIRIAEGLDPTGVERVATREATTLGQPIFVIELPADGRSGYLAGAVLLQTHLNKGPVYSKVVSLD